MFAARLRPTPETEVALIDRSLLRDVNLSEMASMTDGLRVVSELCLMSLGSCGSGRRGIRRRSVEAFLLTTVSVNTGLDRMNKPSYTKLGDMMPCESRTKVRE